MSKAVIGGQSSSRKVAAESLRMERERFVGSSGGSDSDDESRTLLRGGGVERSNGTNGPQLSTGYEESGDDDELCGFKLRRSWIIFTMVGIFIVGAVIGYNVRGYNAGTLALPQHQHDAEEQHQQQQHQPDKQQHGNMRAPPKTLGFDLDSQKVKIKDFKRMLVEYYGSNGQQILSNAMCGEPPLDKSKTKYDFLASKIARALIHQDQFVIGAIGSSVVAGHDNCAYDAYEAQLERTMKPLWDAAGVSFAVRNAGQGGGCGDDYLNQIFCVRNMVGDDIDALHYSWGYFEAGGKFIQEAHERLLRWGLLMDHSPALTLLYVGNNLCNPTDMDLRKTYSDYGFTVAKPLGSLHQGTEWKESKWGAIGDTLHNTTRYGERLNVSKARRDSLGVMFRNWHPGPLGFQMVADSFAYYYADAMLRALDMISATIGDASVKSLEDVWPKKPPLLTVDQLPSPVHCGDLCTQPDLPSCVKYEDPTHGRPQIIVLPHSEPMNPFKNNFAPKTDADGWKIWKGAFSDHMPRPERTDPKCKHFDRCGAMRSTSPSDGIITFRLPRMSIGMIVVCCPEGKECGRDKLMPNKSVEYHIEGRVVKANEVTMDWPNRKCVRVQEKFPDTVQDSFGHIHLGIRNVRDDGADVKISHVIAY